MFCCIRSCAGTNVQDRFALSQREVYRGTDSNISPFSLKVVEYDTD